jgi:hypothetical protein
VKVDLAQGNKTGKRNQFQWKCAVYKKEGRNI